MSNGRVNQKLRTRNGSPQAAVELMRTGRDITMLDIAKAALVSEATAYRHFPDLASLLCEAMVGQMPAPADALASSPTRPTRSNASRSRPRSCSATCWPSRARPAP